MTCFNFNLRDYFLENQKCKACAISKSPPLVADQLFIIFILKSIKNDDFLFEIWSLFSPKFKYLRNQINSIKDCENYLAYIKIKLNYYLSDKIFLSNISKLVQILRDFTKNQSSSENYFFPKFLRYNKKQE